MASRNAEEVKRAVRELIRKLRRTHRIERVLLFGSRARGDNLVTSDVDLVIISPDFREVGWRERIISVARLWSGPVRLEPLCYTPDEFRRRSRELSMVRVAREEGIRVA